jgi:hypothetical protein
MFFLKCKLQCPDDLVPLLQLLLYLLIQVELKALEALGQLFNIRA